MAKLSTWGMGGQAAYYAKVTDVSSAKNAFAFAKEKGLPYFIVGKGSNCLFDDRGFRGLIIHQVSKGLELSSSGYLKVSGGENFATLASLTAKQNWAGLEFGIGIPGTVGGAVYMNAGAQGGETFDTLQKVHFLTEDGKELCFQKEELSFGYRFSSFHEKKGLILSAEFQLRKDEEAKNRVREFQDKRKATQPTRFRSAGCTFRNPEGAFAGALIEKAGLKGHRIGDISISDVHGNFLVNHGNGSSHDTLELIELIETKVEALFGKKLQREIKTVTYDGLPS